MGAYGVALLAKEQFETNNDKEYTSTILKNNELDSLKIDSSHVRCGLCENHCLLTINKFSNGKNTFLVTVVREVLEILMVIKTYQM